MIAAFSDVFADVTKQGTKLQTSEYLASGKYPIIDQGQDDIAGYTDRENGLFTDVPAIIFGDHTRIVKYVDMPFFLGADGVKVLKATIPDVDCRYLYYAVSAVKIPNTGYNRHFKWLKEAQIPLPDISTQRRIADTLDKVSEGIEVCRKMLGELDLMVKAKFGEMFGDLSSPECQWEKCHLIEVCANKDDIKCGPFGTQLSKEEYLSEGVAVWEIPQINSQFAKKPTHFLTRQKAEQLSAYSLLPGDIAMSRKGNVGKCAIFPSCFAPGIIHSDVLRIRVDSAKVNPIFMMSQLHYSGAVTRQIEIVSLGAIMAGINVTKLKQIIVHVPPYAIQNRFAAFVAEIDKSKLTIQKILDKMETEKLALMQEYFG